MGKTKTEAGRILVVADPHIHNYSAFDQGGSRLDNCVKLIEEVIKRAEGEGIDTIVCCGDWFDKPVLHATVANAAARVVSALPKGMRILTISGNHDMFSTPRYGEVKETAVSYLAELSDQFVVFDDRSEPVGFNTRVFGIPYYDDPQEYRRALEMASGEAEVESEVMNILVIHQTPKGLDNDMIATDTDPSDPLYDAFDLVLCGHIHTRQFITDKFVVVGTPIHRSNEDQGLEKGYFLVDVGEEFKGKSAKEIMHFVSTRGRYPEFRVVNEGDAGADDKYNYVTVKPRAVQFNTEAASADDFGTGVLPADMVRTFVEKVGNGDPLLIKAGLKLLKEDAQ